MELKEFDLLKDENRWKTFLDKFPDHSPYHKREWCNVLKDTFNFKERSILCFDNEGSLKALLPLWQIRKTLITNSPWRDRNEILSLDPESEKQITDCLMKYQDSMVFKDWKGQSDLEKFQLFPYLVNSKLDLTPGLDVNLKRINKKFGRNIRKAIRNEVVINKENSLTGMIDFYRLFKLTRKRLGVPIFPWKFFENIFHSFSNSSLEIYLGRQDSIPIAGAIVLHSPNSSIYAYGAMDYKYQNTRVCDLLFWEMIEDVTNLGKNTLDLGSDSPFQHDLLRYKRKWGATQESVLFLSNMKNQKVLTRQDVNSPRNKIIRNILKKVPEKVLVMVGTYISKKMG